LAQALTLLFWGYLFVALRIDIGVDLLPDFLGYLFVAIGCLKLQDKFPMARKAGIFSIVLIFFSIPTFFIDIYKISGFEWQAYSITLMAIHLILVYFTFNFLIDIVKSDYPTITTRTKRNFSLYISIHLIQLAFLSFSINIPGNISLTIGLILTVATLIMTISFLVLIRAIRKTSLNFIGDNFIGDSPSPL